MAREIRYEWGLWLYGLLSAFIGGGASALSAGTAVSMIDPEKFNLVHPGPLFLAMGITFLSSGLTPFFAYLKQHPLPAIVTVTQTQTTSLTVETTTEGAQPRP